MKRKKNVFCSVLLALTMVMSLLSPTAVQVYAEEPLQQESGGESIDPAAVVAWADANDNGMIDEGEAAYASLSDALEQKESLLKLHTDYAESSQLCVNVDTVLDLNGHTLSTSETFVAGETFDFFAFGDKTSHLTVKNGTIAASHNGDSVFWKSQNETLTLDNVTVTASGELQYACIYAVDGTVILQNSRVDSIYAEGGSFELDGESAVTSWHITGGTFDVDPATLPGFDSDAYEAVWNEELQTWVVLQKSSDGNDCTHPNAAWNEECGIYFFAHEVYCEDCGAWISVPHIDANEDDRCDVCQSCTHPSAVWDGVNWDSIDHWMTCPECREEGWASHVDDDEDTLCDVCPCDMSDDCSHETVEYAYIKEGHQQICGVCGAVIAQREHDLAFVITETGHTPYCMDEDCTYDDFEEEAHYEGESFTDHRCDGCGEYVRAWCTPVSATDHYCVNGENCGARLTDLCTDEDENHICDGCNEWMDWLCEDENDDHLCDGANCGLRLSICADDDTDGKCDICGKTFAAVTAQYTAVAYEAEGEEAFASGTLKVTANIAGSITAVWGYGKEQVGVTQRLEADVSADLLFEDVPLYDLDFVELTFTPDDEDASAVTLSHYISEDLVTLDVEALTGFDEETYGSSVADTVINGIPCETLYLRPGAAVTVKVDLLPTDSWQAGEFKRENYRPVGIVEGTEGKFYYEDTAGEIKSADAAIDGDDAISFTLPAEVGDRAWLDIFCTHGECANSNQDHWCDSSICEEWMPGADANDDDLCDVCGQSMFLRSDDVEDCSLEQLLDSASDGDIVKLLADSNIASDGYDAVWFEPDEDITVTVDLNGFTLSATESLYLLGVGNGTLKIIDSSESKDGKLCNLQNDGILDLDGGTVDLSGHPDPGGMALINYRNEPAAVSGHTGDPTPIRLILPEGYGVVIETGGETLYTSIIPANSTAVVVKVPVLTLEGESGVLCNAHLIARKVLVAGYLEGQLKAVQVVETVTEEIVLTDEVLAYVSAQGGEVKVFLLNGDYAPNYRVLSSK